MMFMQSILMFAGPNGSGKSTITSKIAICGDYINADSIKEHLKCTDLEAAKIAELTREYYLQNGKNFTFETVLSTKRNISLLQRAKEQGYRIVCIYILTADPEINKKRVSERVKNGGHSVPPEKITTRYIRALQLLPQLFTICDELYIFDNTEEASKSNAPLIVKFLNRKIEIKETSIWTKDKIKSLLAGTYPRDYLNTNT